MEEGKLTLSHQRRSTPRLNDPDHTGDLRAPKVDALEAVEVRGTGRDGLLERAGGAGERQQALSAGNRALRSLGVDDHGDVGIRVEGRVPGRRDADDDLASVGDATVTNEPPGRLGREEGADEDTKGRMRVSLELRQGTLRGRELTGQARSTGSRTGSCSPTRPCG